MAETLTAEERALLEKRLTEAKEALHTALIGGHARVVVDSNGERVEFTATNTARLRAYIAELELRLGKTTSSGPLNVWMQ